MSQSQTILLVDDQQMVLEPMQEALSMSGYHVLAASGGQEGVELFSAHSNAIDLVIADIKMPVKSGADVAREIRKVNADIPVLFITSQDQYESLKAIGEFSNYYLLHKPFSLECLLGCISSVVPKNTGEH